MKKLSVIAAIAALFFIGCSKENINPENENQPETPAGDIVCIDGTLHFSSSEVFLETVRSLTKEGADLAGFEKSHGFTSMSSVIDQAIDILSEQEDEMSYNAALESYSDILQSDDDGWITPRISARGYTNIINPEGVYYINGTKYQITPEKLVIESANNTTRAKEVAEFDYISPVDENFQTRVKEDYEYTNDKYQSGDRRAYARAHIIRYIVNVGSSRYDISIDFQMHMTGQKKSLFGWNTYATVHTVEGLLFTIVQKGLSTSDFSGGQVVASNPGVSSYTSSECKDYFLTIPTSINLRYAWVVSTVAPTFSTLRYRALNRGTGDCGIAYNMITAPTAPISSCR